MPGVYPRLPGHADAGGADCYRGRRAGPHLPPLPDTPRHAFGARLPHGRPSWSRPAARWRHSGSEIGPVKTNSMARWGNGGEFWTFLSDLFAVPKPRSHNPLPSSQAGRWRRSTCARAGCPGDGRPAHMPSAVQVHTGCVATTATSRSRLSFWDVSSGLPWFLYVECRMKTVTLTRPGEAGCTTRRRAQLRPRTTGRRVPDGAGRIATVTGDT